MIAARLLALNIAIQSSSICFAGQDRAILANNHISGAVPVKSWKTLRDDRVVKQDLDYSCGAASMATILNEYYGQSVTEKELLEAMDKGDLRASFDDMQQVLPKVGFRAVGYALNFAQLSKLKIPVLVYVKYRKNDHFSVLRGIDDKTVLLADPSFGNRTYSRAQFLDMWETREDAQLKGKILAILPNDKKASTLEDFFITQPRRQTAQAVNIQSIRNIP